MERPPSSKVRILFAGRLIERKGPDKVLDAAQLFPDATFRIIGSAYGKEDGVFADQLRHRVREDRLNNVEFIGKVSQEELRQFLWDSDILFHPSRVEGIPRVTLEAGATGLPSIVMDAYQTPSVVDGVTGFQVKSVDEMFDRLRTLDRKSGTSALTDGCRGRSPRKTVRLGRSGETMGRCFYRTGCITPRWEWKKGVGREGVFQQR